MNQIETNEIQEIFEAQNAQLQKLHEIVAKTIEEEGLIINNLKNPPQEILSRGQKISDKVARFGGSWKFIIAFTIVLIIWILFNSLALTSVPARHPRPRPPHPTLVESV